MKRLFLTSSVNFVAKDIAKKINKKGLKLAFVLTPTEVEEGDLKWLKDDRKSLVDAGFIVTDYTITGKNKGAIEKFLKDFDVIYMSGGNTFYLLEQMQKSNSKKVFVDLVEKGKIYIGSSAGSIIAGPDISPIYAIDRIENAPNLKGFDGLGLVDFVVFPHWGSKHFKEVYLNHRLENAYNTKNRMIVLTDNSYIEVRDDWYRIIEVKN